LLLAQIYISLKRYSEAEEISKDLATWKCKAQLKEIKHLAAVLLLKQGKIREGKADLVANKEYAASSFFYGIF